MITIADTGVGIPPEIADRVFDQFFTTKPVGAGTGQGLAIAYRAIHDHSGTITSPPSRTREPPSRSGSRCSACRSSRRSQGERVDEARSIRDGSPHDVQANGASIGMLESAGNGSD